MKKARKLLGLMLVLLALLSVVLVSCTVDNAENNTTKDNLTESTSAPTETDESTPSQTPDETEPTVPVVVRNEETDISEEALLSVIEPLLDVQEEYYSILSAEIYNVTEGEETAEGRMFYCSATLSVKTKYASVEELPQIQGLLEGTGFEELAQCRSAASGSDAQRRDIAKKVLEFIDMVELDFGKVIDTSYTFALLTDESCNVKEVYGVGDDDVLFAFENYFPQSTEEMYQSGVRRGQQIIENAENN